MAPGVGRGACCVPPPGVPIVASWACAPPSSAPALSSVFTILDGNDRWCVDVSFPDGPPAAPGADFCVCGPPSGPSVSAGAYFFAVVRFCPRSIAPFVPFTSIQYSVMVIRGNGVTLRTQKVIQGGDNGHVGHPCEVSPAPPSIQYSVIVQPW